jgi:hypothetical protein
LSFQFNLTTQHEQEIGASYQTNLAILIATGFGAGIDFYLMLPLLKPRKIAYF